MRAAKDGARTVEERAVLGCALRRRRTRTTVLATATRSRTATSARMINGACVPIATMRLGSAWAVSRPDSCSAASWAR